MIPKKLQKGDIIGIVSPSGAVSKNTKKQLIKGAEFFKKLGFKIKVAKNALNTDHYSAGTPMQRAEDINTMFSDKAVDAIICSQGGGTANGCLPYINWDIIKKNPKIFLGISDITVLLNAIYKKTRLVTFHGNDVMWGFGRKFTNYDKEEFKERLINGKIGKINRNSVWKTVRKGVAEGKLLGGNINCIMKLIGTPYFPNLKNSILFLEACNITDAQCDHIFEQMKQAGVFSKIKGVIVGYIYGLQKINKKQMQMEDVLLKVTKDYNFPILKINDFGHNCPNTTMPVGAMVRLDASKKEIEILEKCVK